MDETESVPAESTPAAPESAECPAERWWRERGERRDKELVELLGLVRRDHPGLRFAVVGYDGSGDEGFMQYAGFVRTGDEAEDADAWNPPEGLVVPAGVDVDRLGELLHEFPPAGYQDNEGGHGVVRVDLETGEVAVGHCWVVTSHEEDPREHELGPILTSADDVEDGAD